MRRAYIVDDDPGFRQSLKMLLEVDGWEVEEFGTAKAFLDRSGDLGGGLLLLDVNMPGKSGLELLETARPSLERFAIVVVTGAGQVQMAVRAMKAGALDFIEKSSAPEEFVERLSALDAELQASFRDKAEAMEAKAKVERLSPREREVLERLLAGESNKLVARSLNISPRTIEMHRARMLERLSVRTTAEALDLARRAGLKPGVPS